MKMKKLTSLCGCLLLSMCMGVGAMTAPLSAEAAAREKVMDGSVYLEEID